MLTGGSILSGFDNRNASAVAAGTGGIVQLANYAVGLRSVHPSFPPPDLFISDSAQYGLYSYLIFAVAAVGVSDHGRRPTSPRSKVCPTGLRRSDTARLIIPPRHARNLGLRGPGP